MSNQAAKHFYLRMLADQEFVRTLDRAETLDQRLAIARSQDFDFTREEFEQATEQLTDAKSLEEFLGSEADVQAFASLALSFLGFKQAAGIVTYGDAYFYSRQGPSDAATSLGGLQR